MRLQLAALLLAYSLAGCGSDYYARKHAEERADERATLTQQIESGQLHDVALAQAYMNRGHSWPRSEDFVRAMADFDQAVAAAPAFPEAYFARAKLRLRLADFAGRRSGCVTGRRAASGLSGTAPVPCADLGFEGRRRARNCGL